VDSASTHGNDWRWRVDHSGRPFRGFHSFADNPIAGDGLNPPLSADGNVVAFQSEADLVPDDPGFPVDVFVHAHS
jgi:hypothetical protein